MESHLFLKASHHRPGTPIILVGTKCDLRTAAGYEGGLVSEQEGKVILISLL